MIKGTVGRDAEVKTDSGALKWRADIAVSVGKDETQWVTCYGTGNATHIRKGAVILVRGNVKVNHYVDGKNETRVGVKCFVEGYDVVLFAKKEEGGDQ